MTAVEQSGLLGELSASEAMERDAILGMGGRMAASMRLAEASTWPAGMLAELWRWACWLVMVRGYRGQTTAGNYARALISLGGWLAAQMPSADWRAINLDALEGWLKAMFIGRRHGKSHRSVACSAVKSFYRWRSHRGRGRDCSLGLVAPRVDRQIPRRHSDRELRAIFAVVESGRTESLRARDRCMLLMLLTTGARREEASRLRISDITLDGAIAVVKIDGKGAKQRTVAIEGPVIKALLTWLEVRATIATNHDRLFVGLQQLDNPPALSVGGVERVTARYAARAKVRHSGVHVWRGTFATQLYDDGTDIERIRIVMGHESIETTRRYIAVSNRQRSVRLKPYRQHAALGTAPEGLPRWARQLEGLGDETA